MECVNGYGGWMMGAEFTKNDMIQTQKAKNDIKQRRTFFSKKFESYEEYYVFFRFF